jgi:hypothetical protein
LREDSDDGILDILVPEVQLVLVAEEVQGEEGEEQDKGVGPLGAHLPGGDLRGVGLGVPVVRAGMQPVTVVVHMELLEVAELIQRMMLQVVYL